jgi:signal transduction histidine kinase
LRNLPFIIVSNPNISKIYNNYLHSLSTLLPYQAKPIKTLEEEARFTETMADLVQTHANTIPTLAKGFLECRKYISPDHVTRFLDEHLRARIGTRLIAEQHIALHLSSQAHDPDSNMRPPSSYIGVIDTALAPAAVLRQSEHFVADICEYKYGVRPSLKLTGAVDTTVAHIPTHLEYILTELLKNSFRATVEAGREREPIEVTIALGAPPMSDAGAAAAAVDSFEHVTIRIRDRGGGIAPEHLPCIWGYSFTTFKEDEARGGIDALNVLSAASGDGSSIAGLGYGLPLSRAYAEYFGGGIQVQSLWGWGTDVYLHLRGLGGV